MKRNIPTRATVLALLIAALGLALAGARGLAGANRRENGQGKQDTAPATPRGTRLILTDGTFLIVRSYERKGERVRYYSLERAAWEEIPADLVNWDATAKADAERKNDEEALAKKVRVEEESRRMDLPMEVDASLPVGPGLFLPSGEGLFAVQGKTITLLEQVVAEEHTDKKAVLRQVFVPIPLPRKQNLEIPGAKAKVRLTGGQPEFYLREASQDADIPSRVRHSSRAGEAGPAVELIRVKVMGDKRRVDSVSTYFGGEKGSNRQSIEVQRWEVAPNVFKFTIGETLKPGEYVFAEFLPDGMNLFVWDFGIDASGKGSAEVRK